MSSRSKIIATGLVAALLVLLLALLRSCYVSDAPIDAPAHPPAAGALTSAPAASVPPLVASV